MPGTAIENARGRYPKAELPVGLVDAGDRLIQVVSVPTNRFNRHRVYTMMRLPHRIDVEERPAETAVQLSIDATGRHVDSDSAVSDLCAAQILTNQVATDCTEPDITMPESKALDTGHRYMLVRLIYQTPRHVTIDCPRLSQLHFLYIQKGVVMLVSKDCRLTIGKEAALWAPAYNLTRDENSKDYVILSSMKVEFYRGSDFKALLSVKDALIISAVAGAFLLTIGLMWALFCVCRTKVGRRTVGQVAYNMARAEVSLPAPPAEDEMAEARCCVAHGHGPSRHKGCEPEEGQDRLLLS